MSANKGHTAHYSNDDQDIDLPDLSTDYWAERIAKAKVKRGRPKTAATKVSMTIQLDPDVIEAFKVKGPGWQSRMNDALRKAAGLQRR